MECDDAYSYPLLVELDRHDISRLKRKLVIYFQSRRSDGGDCEVEYESGSRTAVVRFRSAQDQRNVLARATHELSVDNSVCLRMTVRPLSDEETMQEDPGPPDEPTKKPDAASVDNKQSSSDELPPAAEVQAEAKGSDSCKAEEEPCSTAVVLESSDVLSQEFFEMLVENVLKNPDSSAASQSFTLEVIPEISSAVVTFQDGKETADFVARCLQCRMFKCKKLSVRPLEATKQVVVEDMQHLSQDLLDLYFENEGGQVDSVELNDVEQSAIVTFQEYKAVQKIMKKKHHIRQKEIRVFPFYQSLGTALYGKDRPALQLPPAVCQTVDNTVWRYLHDSQSAAEMIQSDLAKHFCNVNLEKPTVCLSPMHSLLQQKGAKATIKAWGDTVKSAFAQAVSKFKTVKFQPESAVWVESEENLRKVLQNKDVTLVADKSSGVLSVVGLADEVSSLEETLCEIIKKMNTKGQREKSGRTQVIKLSPSIFHLLCQDGLQEKLLGIYPELKMSFSKESSDLTITGLSDEILEANKLICNAICALKRFPIEIDTFVLGLLKVEEQEMLTNALLTSCGINAAFEISEQRVQLLAFSDKSMNEAKDHLQGLLISQHIDVEDNKVLQKSEWQHLVAQVEKSNSEPWMRLQVLKSGQQIVVSGQKDSVVKVCCELSDFLTQNAHIEETVPVKPNAIVEYIKKLKTSCFEKVKDKVVVSFGKEAISLSGCRVHVTVCKTIVQDLVSSVFCDTFKVTKAGVKKFFQDKESMYVSSILSETRCLVQLTDQSSGGQTLDALGTAVKACDNTNQLLNTKGTKSPRVKHAQSLGCDQKLGQVKTKEGLDITLTKGYIQKAKTEVTVNTVFQDLTLSTGAVSHAILSVAGPKLQQLVQAKTTRGNIGEIIVTDGCNLKSKTVFHAVVPQWDKGQGQAEKTLGGIFKDCLYKAEETGLTSISFPAIGTGNLGFPRDLVASLMLKEISAFSSMKQPKHLKKVVIVLYQGDTQTIQVFRDAFIKEFPSASGGPPSTSPPQNQCPFSKVVSSSGVYETRMGSVTIQVFTGDITKETTDVIVNSSNETFSLKSGVSKAILDAAGQAVQAECQNLGAHPNPGMIMTQPGNLKCKKILHLIGQKDPVKINKVVKEALQMCLKNSYSSVSFPAIGTGQGNVQARPAADAMFDAVIDVLSQSTVGPLRTIRIVVFQPPMLTVFFSSMQQRQQQEAPKSTDTNRSWFQAGMSTLRSIIGGKTDGDSQEIGDFFIKALDPDPACFHICGDSQPEVDSAKQWISNLITKDQKSSEISESAILNLSDTDHKRIVDLQKTMDVGITIQNKKGQASLTIEGFSNVLEVTNLIRDMLKNVKSEEEIRKYVELVADWQYQNQGLQFQSFDSATNVQLELALENKLASVKVTVQGHQYTVTMPHGPATDSQGRTMQIQRIDKLKVREDIPAHWDTMPPNTSSQAFTIKAGATEHTEVLNLFQASCNQTVIKIERIQNPVLWKSVQIKKRDMEQRNGHQNNERRLFHGTCHTTVAEINEHGFNRSYAGMNAALFGKGTYFAVNAKYSANDQYSKPNQNGEKCMYLCRVLTGDYTAGKPDMIVPPAKGPASIQKYDSVVDKTDKPNMFVIFHDTQAYPEYLITFK